MKTQSKFIFFVLNLLFSISGLSETKTLLQEDFRDLSKWKVDGSTGMKQGQLSLVEEPDGKKSLCLDYELNEQGGYIRVNRIFLSPLPPSYQIQFSLKGQSQKEVVEFKMQDPTGKNVWWHRFLPFDFSTEFTPVKLYPEDITYAWGPDATHPLTQISGFDFVITAEHAIKGKIWIKDFSFIQTQFNSHPIINASSSDPAHLANAAADGKASTSWRSLEHSTGLSPQWLVLDLNNQQRFGGLFINWERDLSAKTLKIQSSSDKKGWKDVSLIKNAGGLTTYVPFTSVIEARYLKLDLLEPANGTQQKSYGIDEIFVKSRDITRSNAEFMYALAQDRPAGAYHKYLSQKQSYWTVVPMPRTDQNTEANVKAADPLPVLLNEEGMIEIGNSSMTLEPTLYIQNRLYTWADVHRLSQSLEQNYLPMPSSTWTHSQFELKTTAFAQPKDQLPVVFVRYEITNKTSKIQDVFLNLGIKPVPITPPWQVADSSQWMNNAINHIKFDGTQVFSENTSSPIFYSVVPLDTSGVQMKFGAKSFYAGPLYDDLKSNELPKLQEVSESLEVPFAKPSGVLQYRIQLRPNEPKEIYVALTTGGRAEQDHLAKWNSNILVRDGMTQFKEARLAWQKKLNKTPMSVSTNATPAVQTLKTAVAHILANTKGSAFEPGPRRYATSWVRDGSVMASSLLQMGYSDQAKDFARWFSRFQRENGFIPCCITVDKEDPGYIEYDSNGQFLFLITEVFRYTNDRALVQDLWPKLKKAVAFIQHMRSFSMTEEYRTQPDKQAYYGLVPASVSHEGYLGNPVHAYWDNYWTLRGLNDVTWLAQTLGYKKEAQEWQHLASDFKKTLFASIRRVIRDRKISYIPASVELADYDASTVAVAISLLGEEKSFPQNELKNTMKQYLDLLEARINGTSKQINYSAYEIRLIEPLIRLGMREEAQKALSFYLSERRPNAWNQWPEITWKDRTLPSGIGDMPHTWIAAEYVKAVRSFFVYENPNEQTLVIGAGFNQEWLSQEQGVRVNRMMTDWGALSYKITPLSHHQNQSLHRTQTELSLRLEISALDVTTVSTVPRVKWLAPIGCQIEDLMANNGQAALVEKSESSIILRQGINFSGEVTLKCQ